MTGRMTGDMAMTRDDTLQQPTPQRVATSLSAKPLHTSSTNPIPISRRGLCEARHSHSDPRPHVPECGALSPTDAQPVG